MRVDWTPKSLSTFRKILDYLTDKWTEKEVNTFVDDTEKTIEQIKENPYMYKAASGKNKAIRKGFVNKQVSLFYRVKPRKKIIELIRFWDNKENPEKLSF